MRLPNTILIDKEEVSVGWMPRREDNSNWRGLYYEAEQEIEINRDLGDKTQASTLIHEVCHAVLAPLKLREKQEERIVLRLEEGLTSLLRDNPTLVTRLCRILRGLPA